MIQLDNVSKVFQRGADEVRALDEISMTVAEGEYVSVRGHSGSGKSTLLSLIGGLARPTVGSVVVGGNTISAMSSGDRAGWRKREVGFVFQLFHLLPYLNVTDNVMAAATSDARERAHQLLEEFGLGARLRHRPGQLSTGERQRVAMARALINNPKLLLADEPTGNLDPENAEGVLDLMDQFHRDGGTIILVTHSGIAADRAQRTIEMRQGKIEAPIAEAS